LDRSLAGETGMQDNFQLLLSEDPMKGENRKKSHTNILLPCALKGVWHLMRCQCAANVDCCSLKPYKETKLTKGSTDNIAATSVSWMSNTLQPTAL